MGEFLLLKEHILEKKKKHLQTEIEPPQTQNETELQAKLN